MINKERLVKTFSELVAIDSPTFGERLVADHLKEKLLSLGITAFEDDAGSRMNGNCGNLFARVPGDETLDPLLFCTHMDTVEPSCGKKAVVHADGKITSEGKTVLGADDFAGVAAVLEVLKTLRENGEKHHPIELIFSAAEERYCTGIRYFDFTQCKAKTGFVLDLTGAVGTVALSAPTILSFTVTLFGKASHAGFAPEMGINTVAAAAKAMASLQQGRLDEGTTLNFGVITAGKAANIVADRCEIRGEIRSAEHERAMDVYGTVCAAFENACCEIGAHVEFSYDIPIHAYRVTADSDALARFARACKAADVSMQTTETFGGSDNAAMKLFGIDGIVVANAMFNCHGTDEYTTVDDLVKTAEIVYRILTDKE